MISIVPVLEVGDKENGKFVSHEEYSLGIDHIKNPFLIESVNEILTTLSRRWDKYARLILSMPGITDNSTISHGGFILASFKKIKLKNKGYRWVLEL